MNMNLKIFLLTKKDKLYQKLYQREQNPLSEKQFLLKKILMKKL